MSFTDYPYYFWLIGLLLVVFNLKKQHHWLPLLFFSLIFYGYGRWEYLVLLFISTCIDYFCGLGIAASNTLIKRRLLLITSIASNLSILFFFKYFPGLYEDWSWIQSRANVTDYLQNIVLPLGISFYTLQSMGYTIDVYLKKIKPERHFGYFALYVCFFPQLVAGPIERPQNLLPQLRLPKTATVENLQSGLFLIGFGLFKKLIVSDRLFILLNESLTNSATLPGWQAMLFGTVCILTLYTDISAYTDIARGSSRLFGIELSLNFNRPMHALSAGEFWQRWHISLTTWIMTYIFMPMAQLSKSRTYRNFALFITFLIIGLWHGGAVPYMLLGAVSGVAIVSERLALRSGLKWPNNSYFNSLRYIRTQILVNISGVLFLAPDMDVAMNIFSKIFYSDNFFAYSKVLGNGMFFNAMLMGGAMLILLMTTEKSKSLLNQMGNQLSIPSKYALIHAQFLLVIVFAARDTDDFIYFIF